LPICGCQPWGSAAEPVITIFYRTGLVVIAVPIRAELDDSSVKRNADPPAHANDHSLALEYAPAGGCFETSARIGDRVEESAVIATIGEIGLRAPISGVIRGLTRNGVEVAIRTKVIEVDPRGNPAAAFGLGERPRRIAEGVLKALTRAPVLAL
jgi:hypothetical protein